MQRKILELKSNTYHYKNAINRFENKCPLCHVNIHLDSDDMLGHNILSENCFEVFFKCPQCLRAFITCYYKPTSEKVGIYHYQNSLPVKLEEIKLPEELINLSNQFSVIYNEAHAAERYGLVHVAGLGYRKALEFLIKDYLINCRNENADEIESQFLGASIKLIPHDRIKSAASRAVWLGNDEAHYTRVYEKKDVTDLNTLLKITMDYIVNEITLDNYENDMPDKIK